MVHLDSRKFPHFRILGIHIHIYIYTLRLFNIAMENGTFIGGLPIKNGDFNHGYVSHNQRVTENYPHPHSIQWFEYAENFLHLSIYQSF